MQYLHTCKRATRSALGKLLLAHATPQTWAVSQCNMARYIYPLKFVQLLGHVSVHMQLALPIVAAEGHQSVGPTLLLGQWPLQHAVPIPPM
jgi:hypothetical protein